MNRQPANPAENTAPTLSEDAVARLRRWLEMELTAVETYQLALESTNDPIVSKALLNLRTSHGWRADEIRSFARAHGVTLRDSAGVFRAFSKLVQHGADILGDRAAVAALEDLENQALAMYAKTQAQDPITQQLAIRLFPEQVQSQDVCRSLRNHVKTS